MKRYWLLVMISSVVIGADPVKPVRAPIEGRLEARRPLVPNPSTLVPADFELMIRVQRSTGNFLVYPGTNDNPGIGT